MKSQPRTFTIIHTSIRYISTRFPGPDTRQSNDVANSLKIVNTLITAALEVMLVYM